MGKKRETPGMRKFVLAETSTFLSLNPSWPLSQAPLFSAHSQLSRLLKKGNRGSQLPRIQNEPVGNAEPLTFSFLVNKIKNIVFWKIGY